VSLPLREHETMKNGARKKVVGCQASKNSGLDQDPRLQNPEKKHENCKPLGNATKTLRQTGNFCQDLCESKVMEICDQLVDG
jgi:hypothetical protein